MIITTLSCSKSIVSYISSDAQVSLSLSSVKFLLLFQEEKKII